MKKLWIIGASAMILLAAQAMAATITITQNNPHDSSGGGPFTIQLTSGTLTANGTTVATAGATFISFCVEYSEFISSGGTYTASINSDERALSGGVDLGEPAVAGDPLSVGTAFLFATYSDGPFTSATATAFQQAIWYLEDEFALNATQIAGNAFLQALIPQFGSIDDAKFTNASLGEYGVYVLNLTSGTTLRQDQLIRVPDGGLTVMLLGFGVGGLALLSRKFSK